MTDATRTNRQWRLARYPEGLPARDDWMLAESPIPEPGANQILVRAIYLDVAPYMRARMSPQKNYAAGVKPGDIMLGGGIGEVIATTCKEYTPGDLVVSDFGFGWQEYAVLRPNAVRRVDPAAAPLPYWMEALGLNGLTSYFALYEAARARPGDTVVVSAAAGSVGQITGQLAKLAGCRPIGVTSSAEKAAWCREIGYEDVVVYRGETDLAAAIARACPHGVDVYIDNTAGPIHDAVLQNLAPRARIALVGSVSLAGQFGKPDIGQRFMRQLLIARATMQGFLVSDYQDRYEEGRRRLAAWVASGALKSRFDIAEGIEAMPDAFLRLLTSRNVGKQLVRCAPDPTQR
ncbi:MAG: NADP-dependent oxidoreductase [Methanocella sp.]